MKLFILFAFLLCLALCFCRKGPDDNEAQLRNAGDKKHADSAVENNRIDNKKNIESSSSKPSRTPSDKKATENRRILAVFPYQGKSHHMFLQAFLKVLLKEGYHITTVTTVPMNENFTNHKQIIFQPDITSWADIFEFDQMTKQTSWEARLDLEKLSESFLYPLYRFQGFKQLINGNEKFDLVLLEPFFMQEPLVFLGHRFKCPVIGLATAKTETNQDLYLGRVRNPALEAEWTTCVTRPNMDFFQRAANTFSFLANILEHRFYYLPKREADLYSMVSFPGMNALPPVRELLGEISLTFSNSHQLVEDPTPVPPNLVMIPGLHIGRDVKLPQELATMIENSKHGVILFTMGSMVPISKMKAEDRMLFIRVFSKLQQLVLWKSDIDLPNLPDNVRVFKWLPQRGILAHEKCLAFITHGGMLGKQEALYSGVPLVSIPLFGDQLANTGHSQAAGLGITILYNNITEANLRTAIDTVINDKEYKLRLGKYKTIFQNDVAQSESKLLYWVNHVIEHGGADYLRPKSLDIYWFQYYLLDVFFAFAVIIALTVILLVKCAQGLYRIRFPRKLDRNTDKKQK